jgi:primosomal protein N' (replication factor Y)
LPKNLKEKIKNWKLNFLKTWDYNYKFNCWFSLSLKQKDAYDKILISKNNKILLFGITWSWKTEIYIQLIKTVLDEWKQVLFLIPEIVLWNQILERIKLVFWEDVIILNSITPDAKKTKYFLDILHNKAKIILWTRSALFYPYDNLWLIIIDEEHDNSYISEQAPRYNTLEVAKKIVDINWSKTKLLFWSGTPSVNSMYKAIRGEFELVNLLEKYK